MQWNYLKKKKPPEGKYVLVYRLGGYHVYRLFYEEYNGNEDGVVKIKKFKKWYNEFNQVAAVTGFDYWMELPEPPEVKK